jgi:hypothetical protein
MDWHDMLAALSTASISASLAVIVCHARRVIIEHACNERA